ncbi:hypothetical protein C8R46DRAFT_1031625 [Mycena filopes]|nr:hypothetical protein C8R46DRAFT_1031625 [Mycena filopes]
MAIGAWIDPHYTGLASRSTTKIRAGDRLYVVSSESSNMKLEWSDSHKHTAVLYAFSSDYLGFIIEWLSGKCWNSISSFYPTPDLKARILTLSCRNKNGVLERWLGPTPVEQDPELEGLTFLRHLLRSKERRPPPFSCVSLDTLFVPTQARAGVPSLEKLMAWHDPYFPLPAGAVHLGRGLLQAGFCVGVEKLAPPKDDNHQRLYDFPERAPMRGDLKLLSPRQCQVEEWRPIPGTMGAQLTPTQNICRVIRTKCNAEFNLSVIEGCQPRGSVGETETQCDSRGQ